MSPPKLATTTTSAKGSLIEGKYTEEHLFATAQTIVKKKTNDSKILDINAEYEIPKFDERGKKMKKK